MPTQAAPEAKGDGEETEARNAAVLQLRRHYLKHVKDVDGDRRIDFLAFAYDSPFDLPTPKELAEDYQDTDLSELRALHEQAEESSQIYFGVLESAIENGTDDQKEIEKRWWEFCQIVARKNVVQILLTSAAVHGPEDYHDMVQGWDSPIAGGSVPSGTKEHGLIQEIAAKILEVLDPPPSEWPSTMTDLLKRVDELRGVSKRTTYRYLYEKGKADESRSMHDWKEWAEDTV